MEQVKYNVFENADYTRLQFIWIACGGRHDKRTQTIGRREYAREKVVISIDPDILSAEDKVKALNAVNLIKQKETEQSRAKYFLMVASRKYHWERMKVSHCLTHIWNQFSQC